MAKDTPENIKIKVEERVKGKQKDKEFKDTSVVEFTRKYQASYDLITAKDLSDIEKDPITAYKLIDKAKIWPVYNVADQKEKGFSSGVVFLKTKIRESLGSKPEDNKESREFYLNSITELQEELEKLNDIYKIKDYLYTFYKKWGIEITKHILKGRNMYGEYVHDKSVLKIWSMRFINQIRFSTDSARASFLEANLYNSFSESQQQFFIDDKRGKAKIRLDKLNSFLSEVREAKNEIELRVATKSYVDYITYDTKKTFNDNKLSTTKYLETSIVTVQGQYDSPRLNDSEKVRDEDWSWAGEKVGATPKTKEEKDEWSDSLLLKYGISKKNKPEPLAYIKRVGGLEIPEISVSSITKHFGYKDVVFGNYVKDKESKEHVRHFLGAMLDLSELMNVNIEDINKMGDLSIFFGALGCGSFSGAQACYYPARKAINLTKKRGDGTLAHEWAHYFDNIIGEGSERKAKKSTFATMGGKVLNDKPLVKVAIKAFSDFLLKGEPFPITIKIDRFHKKDYPKYRIYGGGDTVEDAIKGIQEKFPNYGIYSKMKEDINIVKYYRFLATKFNQDEITVPFTVTTSKYYFTSQRYDVPGMPKYYTDPAELFARAFEAYTEYKLEKSGRHSNYLASIVNNLGIMAILIPRKDWPYPNTEETIKIAEIFDNLISSVKEAYNIRSFSWYTENRQDEYIELSGGEVEKVDTGVIVKKEKNMKKKSINKSVDSESNAIIPTKSILDILPSAYDKDFFLITTYKGARDEIIVHYDKDTKIFDLADKNESRITEAELLKRIDNGDSVLEDKPNVLSTKFPDYHPPVNIQTWMPPVAFLDEYPMTDEHIFHSENGWRVPAEKRFSDGKIEIAVKEHRKDIAVSVRELHPEGYRDVSNMPTSSSHLDLNSFENESDLNSYLLSVRQKFAYVYKTTDQIYEEMIASGKIERKKEPTFEEKYGVSAVAINDKYNELLEKTKTFSIYDAYRVLTDVDILYEDKNEFAISFINEINEKGIKLKKKIEVSDGILLFKSILPNPIKKTGIESLYDVTAKDDLKPNLSGVYIDGENMVATDGHALVIIRNPSYKKFSGKILDVKTGKEINEKFPDYKSVIPYDFHQYTKFMPIDELIGITNGFKDALKNIKLSSYHEDRAVIIYNFNGKKMDLDFGIRYSHTLNALQALKANGAKTVRIGINVPNKPIVIYSDNGNIALVMPTMINDNIIKTNPIKLSVFKENEGDPDTKKEDSLFSELEEIVESFGDCLKRNGINLEKDNHKFEVGTIVTDNLANIKLKVDSFNDTTILFDRIYAFGKPTKAEAHAPVTYSQLIETFKSGGISVDGFSSNEVMEFARVLNTIQHCIKMDKLHKELEHKKWSNTLPDGALVGIGPISINGFRSITKKNGTTIFEGFIENRYFKIQNDSNDWYVLDGTVEADEFKLWLDSKSLHQDDNVYNKWIESLDSDMSMPASKLNNSIYLKEVIIIWQEGSSTVTNKSYTNIKEVEHQMGVTGSLKGKDVYYDKNKLIFIWEDGHTEEDRIDVGLSKGDFNPETQSLSSYLKESIDELNGRMSKNYVLEFKQRPEILLEDKNKLEVNSAKEIKETISGLRVLLSLESDKSKKKEIKDVILGLNLLL